MSNEYCLRQLLFWDYDRVAKIFTRQILIGNVSLVPRHCPAFHRLEYGNACGANLGMWLRQCFDCCVTIFSTNEHNFIENKYKQR